MRGSIAKENVIKKLQEAFGADYLGIYDKKVIVKADDGGDIVPIALALTCPKNDIATYAGGTITPTPAATTSGDFDFENMATSNPATQFQPAEITPEETENIRKFLAEFDL